MQEQNSAQAIGGDDLSKCNGNLENYNENDNSASICSMEFTNNSSQPTTATTLQWDAAAPPNDMLTDYKELLLAVREQAEFFRNDTKEKGQRLYAALVAWQDFIIMANELVQKIDTFSYKYDMDESTPGNGYRSFVSVSHACIKHGIQTCTNLSLARNAVFFRKKYYMKEVEACCQLLSSLCTCLRYLLILHEWSTDSNDLFGNCVHSADELFEKGDTINQYCFYGRCLGFQYSDAMRNILRFVSISMTSFSETFYANNDDGTLIKTTRSLWSGGKYLLNPELRSRRIVNLSQNAKIDFCKAFWFLAESELMHTIPSLVGSSIKINQVIEIPAEVLQLPLLNKQQKQQGKQYTEKINVKSDEMVDIPLPTSHLGPGKSIAVRVLSNHRREGMMGLGTKSFQGWHKLHPRSPGILFHCHGGGFVAQSSKSHELYLRDWSIALNVPIFSVDYSLAPQAPFPRAIEEAFYAYCWMLHNAEYLGSTAEKVILAGDSAGANLVIGVTLKCISLGVRIPDGLFLAYCPTLISFVPSPARLLCLMDSLLPFGFMMRCLQAYAAPTAEIMRENSKSEQLLQEIRKADENEPHYKLSLDVKQSDFKNKSLDITPCTSSASSLAENSKWEQIKFKALADKLESHDNAIELKAEKMEYSTEEDNTFASASYHSQSIEHTDLPSLGADSSSLSLSLEHDSQPIEHYPTHTYKTTGYEQYIDCFVNSYILEDTDMDDDDANTTSNTKDSHGNYTTKKLNPAQAQTLSEENLLADAGKNTADGIQDVFYNALNRISTKFTQYTQSYDINNDSYGEGRTTECSRGIEDLRNMDALIARSPSLEFAFEVPKDPFLSPYYASDEWLQQMPKTKILSLEMDPCLDDCVMFAKKLKRLNRPVTLDILKGLPHGFLNFTMISSECMEGSNFCIKCLKELMDQENNATNTINSNDTDNK